MWARGTGPTCVAIQAHPDVLCGPRLSAGIQPRLLWFEMLQESGMGFEGGLSGGALVHLP